MTTFAPVDDHFQSQCGQCADWRFQSLSRRVPLMRNPWANHGGTTSNYCLMHCDSLHGNCTPKFRTSFQWVSVSVHHLKLLSSAIPSMVIVFPIQWVSVSDIRPGSIFNAVESDARKSFKSKLVERQRLLSVASSVRIIGNGCTDRVVPVSEFEVHYWLTGQIGGGGTIRSAIAPITQVQGGAVAFGLRGGGAATGGWLSGGRGGIVQRAVELGFAALRRDTGEKKRDGQKMDASH